MLLRIRRNVPDNRHVSHLTETDLWSLGCSWEDRTVSGGFGLALGRRILLGDSWKGCLVALHFSPSDGMAGVSKGARAHTCRGPIFKGQPGSVQGKEAGEVGDAMPGERQPGQASARLGLDCAGRGGSWQGGRLRLARSVQGGLWGRGKGVAIQRYKKQVMACGSHRHRQQERVAGTTGKGRDRVR